MTSREGLDSRGGPVSMYPGAAPLKLPPGLAHFQGVQQRQSSSRGGTGRANEQQRVGSAIGRVRAEGQVIASKGARSYKRVGSALGGTPAGPPGAPAPQGAPAHMMAGMNGAPFYVPPGSAATSSSTRSTHTNTAALRLLRLQAEQAQRNGSASSSSTGWSTPSTTGSYVSAIYEKVNQGPRRRIVYEGPAPTPPTQTSASVPGEGGPARALVPKAGGPGHSAPSPSTSHSPDAKAGGAGQNPPAPSTSQTLSELLSAGSSFSRHTPSSALSAPLVEKNTAHSVPQGEKNTALSSPQVDKNTAHNTQQVDKSPAPNASLTSGGGEVASMSILSRLKGVLGRSSSNREHAAAHPQPPPKGGESSSKSLASKGGDKNMGSTCRNEPTSHPMHRPFKGGKGGVDPKDPGTDVQLSIDSLRAFSETTTPGKPLQPTLLAPAHQSHSSDGVDALAVDTECPEVQASLAKSQRVSDTHVSVSPCLSPAPPSSHPGPSQVSISPHSSISPHQPEGVTRFVRAPQGGLLSSSTVSAAPLKPSFSGGMHASLSPYQHQPGDPLRPSGPLSETTLRSWTPPSEHPDPFAASHTASHSEPLHKHITSTSTSTNAATTSHLASILGHGFGEGYHCLPLRNPPNQKQSAGASSGIVSQYSSSSSRFSGTLSAQHSGNMETTSDVSPLIPNGNTSKQWTPARFPSLASVLGQPLIPGQGCVGLQNLGNTCFISSVLQSLNAVPELVACLCKALSPSPSPICKWGADAQVAPALASLTQQMWSVKMGSSGVLSPMSFVRAMAGIDSRWGSGGQHDSQEFLHSLLEVVQSETNRIRVKPRYKRLRENGPEDELAMEAEVDARSWHDSIVGDIFGGMLQSKLECQVCRRQSHCFEPFNDLALPIPDKGKVTLQDCLHSFMGKELLQGSESYECGECKSAQPHVKHMQVCRYPSVLILTLKRFAQPTTTSTTATAEGKAFKNGTPVALDAGGLDLSPFCSSKAQRAHQAQQMQNGGSSMRPVYRLISVLHHSGVLEGGHYTAAAKSPIDGHWRLFNDSQVRLDQDPASPSTSAYILFYRLAQLPSISGPGPS